MGIDEERSRLTGSDARSGTPISGVLGKVLTFTAAAGLLIVAFIFSLVVAAVVVTGGLLIWGYVWWKTRELRKQMREPPPGGRVIEGEVIRDIEADDRAEP
jgi:hypothetical protein